MVRDPRDLRYRQHHDGNHTLYYGKPAAGVPQVSEDAVFDMADFFERPDAEVVGNSWIETQSGGTAIDLSGQALRFRTTADAAHRPYATGTHGAYTTSVAARFGFNWQRGTD